MEWTQAEPCLGSGSAWDSQPWGLPTCSVPAQLCCWLLASAVLAAQLPPCSWPCAACPSPSTGMTAPLCAAACLGLAAAVPGPGLLETAGADWHCLLPPCPRASVGSGAGLSPAAWFWDACSCGPSGCFPPGSGSCLSTFPGLHRETLSALQPQLVMPQKHREPVVCMGTCYFRIVAPG